MAMTASGLCGRILMVASFIVGTSSAQQLDPVEKYLASAEKKINGAIENAGTQGRGVTMEAGLAALNAIAAFRAGYADALGKTEDALDAQQAKFFKSIKEATDQLDRSLGDATLNLQGLADRLDVAIRALPFTKDVPRVLKLTPRFVSEGQAWDKELIVSGLGLFNQAPILWVDGKPVAPNTATDTELRFPIAHVKAGKDVPSINTAVLQVAERQSGWVWDSYLIKYYPVRIAVYPSALGKVSVVAKRKVPDHQDVERTTGVYRCESPNGDGSSSVAVSVVATPNWTIAVSSIAWHASYSNHGRTTLNSSTPSGFTATLGCDGFNKSLFNAGEKGVEEGVYKYREIYDGTREADDPPVENQMQWGRSWTVTLPGDTYTAVSTFTFIGGDVESFTDSGTGKVTG